MDLLWQLELCAKGDGSLDWVNLGACGSRLFLGAWISRLLVVKRGGGCLWEQPTGLGAALSKLSTHRRPGLRLLCRAWRSGFFSKLLLPLCPTGTSTQELRGRPGYWMGSRSS